MKKAGYSAGRCCVDCGIPVCDVSTRCARHAAKAQWADPEKRERLMTGLLQHPVKFTLEVRHKISEAMKAAHERGDFGEEYWSEHSKAVRAAHARGCYDGVYHSPSKLELGVLTALEAMSLDCVGQFRPKGCSFTFDVYLPGWSTLIEVDGTYWHSSPKVIKRDAEKDDWAVEHGFDVIRIPECVIENDGEGAIAAQVVSILKEDC